jgi:DNA repair protein RecO (recombination protein O)
MPGFATPAILLRRTEYGDFDIIITFFTLKKGKLSLIAKSGKKSTKRFGGILELFSELEVVGSAGRGKGLPVLQEAMLKQPFGGIRTDFQKTAFASYWAELIHDWMEENFKQASVYYLFQHVLSELDSGGTPATVLNLLFQMRFLAISGHRPNLHRCSLCRKELENMKEETIMVDLKRGGIICGTCAPGSLSRTALSKGTIKQLLWVECGKLDKAARIRFTPSALKEGTDFLEEFVPYHLGKQPRSLKFLRQIRKGYGCGGQKLE